MTAGLDDDGNLDALHVRISGQSILATLMPQAIENNDGMDPVVFQAMAPDGDHAISYTVPDLLVDHAMRNTHITPGFWRGVNVNQNAIYMECFMDEVAHESGQDALAFRQKAMTQHPLALAVLNMPRRWLAGASLRKKGGIWVWRYVKPLVVMWRPVPKCQLMRVN